MILNDGSGTLQVALHETLSTYAAQIVGWLADRSPAYSVDSEALAPNGKEFTLAEGFRNNGKTIYKIPMVAQGYQGRAK